MPKPFHGDPVGTSARSNPSQQALATEFQPQGGRPRTIRPQARRQKRRALRPPMSSALATLDLVKAGHKPCIIERDLALGRRGVPDCQPLEIHAEAAPIIGAFDERRHRRLGYQSNVAAADRQSDADDRAVHVGYDDLPAHQDVQARHGIGLHRPAERHGPRAQPLTDERHDRTVSLGEWPAAIRAGEQSARYVIVRTNRRTGKEAAIAGIEVALSGYALGHEQVVTVEFDMPISDALDAFLGDGGPVDEAIGGNQHLAEKIEAEAVTGRNPQVSDRPIFAERTLGDADRPYGAGLGVIAAVDGLGSDPPDWSMRAGGRHSEIAHHQILDRDFTASGRDPRVGTEADDERLIIESNVGLIAIG